MHQFTGNKILIPYSIFNSIDVNMVMYCTY